MSDPIQDRAPQLSVIIPTHNNVAMLERCLDSWRRHASDQPVELLIIEDGCKDETICYLERVSATDWGKRTLRFFHEDDVHQLRCTNRGFVEARGALSVAWEDDMMLETSWFVPELLDIFERHADIGLLALNRGLWCRPLKHPITAWAELHDPDHLVSTLGTGSILNWIRLTEVDIVIRPWVVRRDCLDRVGLLDEAFCPTEWDEADLAYRIRGAGYKVAVYSYERHGAFTHVGAATIGRMTPESHQRMVLPNGQLFRQRWESTIAAEQDRPLKTWWRNAPPASLPQLFSRGFQFGVRRALKKLTHK